MNKKVMKNIVQYLRVRNWFSFLNVAIRIRSCKRSPFLQYNNNNNPQTNEKANWMNESIYIGERKKENLLFAFEVLRGLDPKKISEGSSYSPRSQVGSTSKASHGIANEGPHISQCSSPTARHRCEPNRIRSLLWFSQFSLIFHYFFCALLTQKHQQLGVWWKQGRLGVGTMVKMINGGNKTCLQRKIWRRILVCVVSEIWICPVCFI